MATPVTPVLGWKVPRSSRAAAYLSGGCPMADTRPTTAAFAAESGDRERVDQALMEASAAATSAFPQGSREADALGVIFTAIGYAASDPEAAGGWRMPEPELGD